MRIYSKRYGYSRRFIAVSEAFAAVVVWALLCALVFGIVYSIV